MPICTVCDSINLGKASNGTRHGTHPETILGSYDELVSRAETGCAGCLFFSKTLLSSLSWQDRLEELKERVVVFNGLRLDARKKNRLDSTSWSCDDLLFDICVAKEYQAKDGEVINREEIDEIHLVPADPLDHKALKQVKTWISECEGHETCSTPRTVELPKRIVEIPIDPTTSPRVCLSEGKTGEYVVLSHCSGKVKSPAITDLPALLDIAILPKTLADAISVTRSLGYRYLWAAPLCITQDDKDDWNAESSRIASTYGKAALMISASEGSDTDSGILHKREVLYSPGLGINKDRFLRLHLLRWKWDLERSPLGKRGWASIERMLAPRILHFTKRQMIWECAKGNKFEASGILDKNYGSGQLRQTYRKEIVQPYIESALLDRPVAVEAVGSEKKMTREVERFESWLNSVDEFSSKDLRDSEDKLRAMTPIASIINDGNMGEYLAGVWSKNIAFGLAWGRVFKLLTPAPIYRAPSWSWASVDGAISSMASSWPETMMQDHSKDPAWLQKYEPKLISQHMILADPAYPYGSVMEGSNIVVSGSCMGLMKLVESLGDDSGFHLTPGMDSSPVFECSYCIKRPDDERKDATDKFNSEAYHHICMIMMGDAWRVDEEPDLQQGFCDLLILRSCEEKNTYEKVGFLRVQKEPYGNTKTKAEANEIWDALEWERKELKLV